MNADEDTGWDPDEPVPLSAYEAEAPPVADSEPSPESLPVSLGGLLIEDVADIADRVDNAPPRRYLAKPVLKEGSYGGLAAEDTSGKSWAMLDLAVAVASGGSWMGVHPCEAQGPVLMFLGEGEEDITIRRGRAVAAHYGLVFEDLPIRICHRVPKLTDELHIVAVSEELENHPARLVILDPLYLASAGVKTSQLTEVGASLYPIQRACQRHGAALFLAHHWNKTGQGTGRNRSTGAGLPEWGRAVASISVVRRAAEGAASIVDLSWEWVGNDMPDARLRIRRRVWAEDPDDAASPLHYEIEVLTGDTEDTRSDRPPSQTRTLAELEAAEGPISVKQIGDALANDGTGRPLRARTIQDALKVLASDGLAHDDDPGRGYPAHWTAGPRPEPPDLEPF